MPLICESLNRGKTPILSCSLLATLKIAAFKGTPEKHFKTVESLTQSLQQHSNMSQSKRAGFTTMDHQNPEPNLEETNFQLPLKRKADPDYVAQNCTSADSCFPPKKNRRICEEKTVLKRQSSQTSKGSKNNSESYSPERKSKRTDTEKKETAVTPSIQKSCTPRSIQHQVEKMDVTTSSDTLTSEIAPPRKHKAKSNRSDTEYPKKSRTIDLPGQKTNDTALNGTRTSENTPKKKERPEDQRGKNVWLIGSIDIRRAEGEARKIFGENFGLDAKVQWFGEGGMRWSGVLPRFYEELSTQSPPDILVIHAGGNDLGLFSADELSSVIEKELMQLHTEFPSMTIAYSSINERQVWRHENPDEINEDRKIVNASIRKAVDRFDGVVIENPPFKLFNNSNCFGVHFYTKANEVFLTSIRKAIKKSLKSRH
ncbi:uncharacterized protein LOC112843101 [Oreochromis niloticus]|uniref:uncharacterized protein LOC112843101 n=1 Tax=Oreochromis niloticus TaxID=8128 RepID=UPI000DF3ABF3|nr:uncharacterized protein LOC112843101 [Oreochromis niloticus]